MEYELVCDHQISVLEREFLAKSVLIATPGSRVCITRPSDFVRAPTVRNVEIHWEDVDVFNPDTAGCLVNVRFDQTAANGYRMVVAAVEHLGPWGNRRLWNASCRSFPRFFQRASRTC